MGHKLDFMIYLDEHSHDPNCIIDQYDTGGYA